jgi:hypothetical protein
MDMPPQLVRELGVHVLLTQIPKGAQQYLTRGLLTPMLAQEHLDIIAAACPTGHSDDLEVRRLFTNPSRGHTRNIRYAER